MPAGLDRPGHHVEHTGGHPALLCGFGKNHGVQGGFRCRLENHGASGSQCRGKLERGQRLRVVPRDDRGHHADRLAANDGVA